LKKQKAIRGLNSNSFSKNIIYMTKNVSTSKVQNFKYSHLELDPNKILFTTINGEKTTEIWKDIPNYEGYYQCSNFGRVKSLEREIIRGNHLMRIREKILKLYLGNRGYYNVGIKKDLILKRFNIHVLVAICFLDHIPCGFKKVVDHKDNDPLNNQVNNLQLITNRKNSSKDKKGFSSKYVGVSWKKGRDKWKSAIYINGKEKHLGFFDDEKLASDYYQNALKAIKNGTEIQVKRKTNTSKHKGIYKKGKKWALQINGKYIGTYHSEREAVISKLKILIEN